jgi:hypothetical protein
MRHPMPAIRQLKLNVRKYGAVLSIVSQKRGHKSRHFFSGRGVYERRKDIHHCRPIFDRWDKARMQHNQIWSILCGIAYILPSKEYRIATQYHETLLWHSGEDILPQMLSSHIARQSFKLQQCRGPHKQGIEKRDDSKRHYHDTALGQLWCNTRAKRLHLRQHPCVGDTDTDSNPAIHGKQESLKRRKCETVDERKTRVEQKQWSHHNHPQPEDGKPRPVASPQIPESDHCKHDANGAKIE